MWGLGDGLAFEPEGMAQRLLRGWLWKGYVICAWMSSYVGLVDRLLLTGVSGGHFFHYVALHARNPAVE
jgi:hypothetical protein